MIAIIAFAVASVVNEYSQGRTMWVKSASFKSVEKIIYMSLSGLLVVRFSHLRIKGVHSLDHARA